jgi:hypothetical protein
MLFGRRKHAAPAPAAAALTSAAPAPAAPQLTDELIFAAVQRTLTEVFGETGDWTVARRSPEQDDLIFHEVLVHSLATSVTASVAAARESLVPTGGPLGLLRAPRVEQPADVERAEAEEDEPAALSWEPAPITRWADLKRPVTGEIAVVDQNKAA